MIRHFRLLFAIYCRHIDTFMLFRRHYRFRYGHAIDTLRHYFLMPLAAAITPLRAIIADAAAAFAEMPPC